MALFFTYILYEKSNFVEQASSRNNYHYNKKLLGLSRFQKRNMTKSAASMWKYVLSRKQMRGYQFIRERPILSYIADFACLELLLIIEVDGISHDNEPAQIRDEIRDQALRNVGFSVLRFSSQQVLSQIGDVTRIIEDWIDMTEGNL